MSGHRDWTHLVDLIILQQDGPRLPAGNSIKEYDQFGYRFDDPVHVILWMHPTIHLLDPLAFAHPFDDVRTEGIIASFLVSDTANYYTHIALYGISFLCQLQLHEPDTY